MTSTRVGLIGAGRMAHDHLASLMAMPSVAVSAIVDPDRRAAQALARQAGSAVRVFQSTPQALAAHAFERAHVVVPPPLHAVIGRQLLTAGIHCLIEKPICTDPTEAGQLQDIATSKQVGLGVNQNLVFHPALVKFRRALDAGQYGRLRFVSLVVAVPLAQLQARRFDHWMFERPSNIILEQLVHPLSQLVHLLGHAEIAAATASPAVEVAPDVVFHKSFDVTLQSAQGHAQLHMAFGESFPVWQLTAVCDDGMAVIDCVRNSISACKRTRFLEAGDIALSLASQGAALLGQSIAGIGRYLGSQLRLVPRSDAFFRGVQSSIQDFHAAIDAGRAPLCDGRFGATLVEMCLAIARRANVSAMPARDPPTVLAPRAPVPHFDVAVFGGTGFIGKSLVQKLLCAGYSVAVIARGVRGLPRCFNDARVTLIRGDVTKREDVVRGMGCARYVVNLAHGGTADTRQATIDLVAGSARTVDEVCLDKRVERLVHISSIAALYLGDSSDVIVPSTPVTSMHTCGRTTARPRHRPSGSCWRVPNARSSGDDSAARHRAGRRRVAIPFRLGPVQQ